MEYSALTIGLTDELFSNIQTLLTSNLRFTPSLTVQDASRLLIQQVFHLLVVDLEYLRSILQVDWLPSVRRVTFVPIVVLSDTPERDLHSLIHHGVDICISSKQAPFLIADIILSQLRRYTEYNHFNNPENAEAASFQAGDIFIDPPRRMVKVRGQSVNLRPREFSLLLYFMRNGECLSLRGRDHAAASGNQADRWNLDLQGSMTFSLARLAACPAGPEKYVSN